VSLWRIAFGLHSDCGYWFQVSRLVVYWWTSDFKFKSSWLCQWSRSSQTKITRQLTSPRQSLLLWFCNYSPAVLFGPHRWITAWSCVSPVGCYLWPLYHYNNNIPSDICLLRLQNLTWGLTTVLHALARVSEFLHIHRWGQGYLNRGSTANDFNFEENIQLAKLPAYYRTW
jgi:hypothetical protein